jgi:hypothetical protein
MERHPGMDNENDPHGKVADLIKRSGVGVSSPVIGQPVQGVAMSKSSRVLGVVEKTLEDGESLGLVFGWAIVCTEKGEAYFDTQDDHIPEESMLKAAADFMEHSRVLGDMHATAEGGSVVFAFPMTAEIAKAYGLTTETTGLMIAVRPATAEVLAKFKSGEYTGFSIGGIRIDDEDAE